MKYRPEIDGLRALAVVPVILFHASFETFSGGFVGVDVFFVISGYLITTILIEDIAGGRFSLLTFYERRARRILPALFVVMLACLPFAWMWMLPSQFKDFSQSLIATSFFASNILFWQESGYFEAASEEKPLLHTWSLAVEEQYYLLFPLFLIAAWRFGRNRVFWSIVVLAALSLMLSEWGWRNKPSANFYLAPTRAWELFAGSIAAFIVHKHGVRANNPLALLGLAAIIFAIFAYDASTPAPSVYLLVPVLGVVLLILFADAETLAARVLGAGPLVGIGLISYSAYLWHQPLFAFARIRSPHEPEPLAMLGLTGAAVALAVISWRFVEQPFRNKVLVPRRTLFLMTPVFLGLPVAIGLTGHIKDGFYDTRFTAEQKSLMASAQASPKRADCHIITHRIPYDMSCLYGTGPTSIAVYGDSHAVELAYAVGNVLEPSDVAVRHLSYTACPPSFGKTHNTTIRCSDWSNDTIRRLIADDSITTVIVTYRIHGHLFGMHEHSFPELPNEYPAAHTQQVWTAYVDQLKALHKGGKKVILVLQAPELPKPMEYLIKWEGQNDIPGLSQDWWRSRAAFVRDNLSDLPADITVVDPAEIFCDGTTCYAARDGEAFYFDDDHMSVTGAEHIARALLPFIRM